MKGILLRDLWSGLGGSLDFARDFGLRAHARNAPQVKPRSADCTARESVWESFDFAQDKIRSSPA